jgi:hypothetical protein
VGLPPLSTRVILYAWCTSRVLYLCARIKWVQVTLLYEGLSEYDRCLSVVSGVHPYLVYRLFCSCLGLRIVPSGPGLVGVELPGERLIRIDPPMMDKFPTIDML